MPPTETSRSPKCELSTELELTTELIAFIRIL